MVPRLREFRLLTPLAAGREFTQPKEHSLFRPCRVHLVVECSIRIGPKIADVSELGTAGLGTVIVAAMLGFGHRSWDSRFSWVKSVPFIRFYPYYYIDVNETLIVRAICTVREGWICSNLMDLPHKCCPMSWHEQMGLESWKSCQQCKIAWIFRIWPPFGDRMV